MEKRDIEIRLAADETGTISGYAAVFGKADRYGDVITRGAFAASLAQHKAAATRPLMLWSHNPENPIGVWDSIVEDAKGLKVEGRLILESTAGRDAYALMKAGAIDGLSIGFRTVKAATNPKGGRTVSAVDLIEISPVARPAQSAARVTAVRSHTIAADVAAFIRQRAALLKGAK